MAERDIFLAALIKKGFDGLNTKVDTLAAVAGEEASWSSIKKVVAAGMAKNAYPVGTQFSVTHTKYGSLLFDVVAHNHHKNPNNENAPTMTLLMHNVIYSRPFDAPEAAYVVRATDWPDGLPAGTYHFLFPDDNKSHAENDGWEGIQFTTTEIVPVSGQITLDNWLGSAHVANSKVSTWEGPSDLTGIEKNLTPTDGTGGTSLGKLLWNSQNASDKINHIYRARLGDNNWEESNIRQWLNSDDASDWWTAKHDFDRLSSTYASLEGFLNGIDPEFAAAIGAVDVVTRKNNVFEYDDNRGNVVYTTRDKVFLMSNDEVGFAVEGIAQGSVVDFYNGAANADRIKYDYSSTATARGWWLRSPYPSTANYARFVGTSGAQNISYAYVGGGAAAACVIY